MSLRFYAASTLILLGWSEWSGAAILEGDEFQQEMHYTNLEKIQ